MKILVEIPDDHKRVIDNLVEDCKGYLLPYEVENRMAVAIRNGKVLDDMTNGEAFLKTHPEVVATTIKKEGYLFNCVQLRNKEETIPFAEVYVRWWNAPYRR